MKHVLRSLAWNFRVSPIPGFYGILYPGRDAHKVCFLHAEPSLLDSRRRAALCHSLPENEFRVTWDKKGNPMIVSGYDDSPRCLLFLGYEHDRLSKASIDPKSTGKILVEVTANNLDQSSSVEAAMLLSTGESAKILVGGQVVRAYIWDGSELHDDKDSVTMKIALDANKIIEKHDDDFDA